MPATEERIITRKYIRVRDRNQITLPNEIVTGTPITVGDFLEILLTESGAIHLIPTKVISSINSAAARTQEALADKDIDSGKYRTFSSADDLMKDVSRKRGGKKKVAAAAAAAGAVR